MSDLMVSIRFVQLHCKNFFRHTQKIITENIVGIGVKKQRMSRVGAAHKTQILRESLCYFEVFRLKFVYQKSIVTPPVFCHHLLLSSIFVWMIESGAEFAHFIFNETSKV